MDRAKPVIWRAVPAFAFAATALVATVLVLFWVAGAARRRASVEAALAKFQSLRIGMTGSEVSAIVGEPEENVGSGVFIGKYPLDDGSAVYVSWFPFGDDPRPRVCSIRHRHRELVPRAAD